MADAFIKDQEPGTATVNIQTYRNTVGGTPVDSEAVTLTDSTGAELKGQKSAALSLPVVVSVSQAGPGSDPFGGNADGASAVGSISAKLRYLDQAIGPPSGATVNSVQVGLFPNNQTPNPYSMNGATGGELAIGVTLRTNNPIGSGFELIGQQLKSRSIPVTMASDQTIVEPATEVNLWNDAVEGGTINAFWTQSTTTMTIAQAAGILTLNNAGITTANTDAIITSQRQFQRFPGRPLHARFLIHTTANNQASHTLQEFGFGAPVGVTATLTAGAFFRYDAAGTLRGVLSTNGTDVISTQLLPVLGGISLNKYNIYDIYLFDDYAIFVVTDNLGVTTVPPTFVSLNGVGPLTTTFEVSHLPTFARTYVDATGGGTVLKLDISEHSVDTNNGLLGATFADQQALCMRHCSINPTSYAQTGQLAAGAAPGAFTPSNTVAGNATLGGEAQVNSTATSENLLSIFAFTIPTPYTYMLRGIRIPRPVITTALTTTACILEWFLIANCSSGNINTGGGQRISLGLMSAAASAAAATVLNGDPVDLKLNTPIPCLPGTVLHIGWKMILGAATGVIRVVVVPDGDYN